MARNVEIEARIDGVGSLLPAVRRIADEGPIEIWQDDTSFCCEAGRLKLRDFGGGAGELIFYRSLEPVARGGEPTWPSKT